MTIKILLRKKERKKLKSLNRYHSANKINNYNREGEKRGKRKKSKRIYRTSQNMKIISVFLESLLLRVLSLSGSHSPPHLPRMPSNTVLISVPAVGAAQILIWSCSSVFLPPVSTAVRTSAFSLVGAYLLYIL